MKRPSSFLVPAVWFACVALCAAPATGQQAGFTTYGAPCTAAGSTTPRIGNRGLPQLGNVFTVTYAGPHAIEPGIGLTEQPVLAIGVRRIDLAIPQWLVTQPAGCTLYPSPLVTLPMAPDRSGRAFVTEVDLRVPNDASLLGGVLHLQWVTQRVQCTFVGCGPLWVVFSDGARAVLGT